MLRHAEMRKFLEATNLRACLFKALYWLFLDLFRWEKLLKSSPTQALVLLQGFLSTVEQEWPSPKPADVLGDCSSDLSSTSLQGWVKYSKYVLYIFLIIFEAGSWKTLRAYELLLAPVSFHCSVCITPCRPAAACFHMGDSRSCKRTR